MSSAQQMKHECFEVDDKINKNFFLLIGRILQRRAKSREPERASKTKVNNDIEVLKESKRHTFQIWSCDIKSYVHGWTKNFITNSLIGYEKYKK